MQGVSYTYVLEQFALQKDRHFLWVPVFLSLGIGLYFALPFEPSAWSASGTWFLSFLAACLAFKYREAGFWQRLVYFSTIIGLLAATGFTAAKIRTILLDAPILQKQIGPVTVTGTVASLENLEEGGGSRIILRNIAIENMPPEKTPYKVRLRLRDEGGIYVGQKVSVLAQLNPPSGPVVPGGFDFRRYLYFSGIGAVGFIYKTPEILEQPKSLFTRGIEGLRQHIAGRIEAALPARESSVTLALMIGQQNALSEEDMEAIRNAGLAHMLSISGLHIVLVAGVMFFISRLLMALVPDLAIKRPIKKYAAIIGIISAVFYMLIAGSPAPTQRSVLMTGIIFLAIILDRSAISLRLVAFAAFVILLFQPDNLISVSFQMSFAAVTALIAFFEGTREYWSRWNQESSVIPKALVYVGGVCMTTLIATLATTPFSVYHFQQFAALGVIANLIAVPLLTFFVMPCIVLAFFLMLLGWESAPLALVGYGVEAIFAISYWAASLPHAVITFSALPFSAFILTVLAGLWIILWKGWGKILVIIPLLAACLLITNHKLPSVLASESHKLFGIYHNNTLYVTTNKTDKFTLEKWEQFYGLDSGSAKIFPQEGKSDFYTCAPEGCHLELDGQKVSLLIDPYEIKRDCAWADILVSVEPVDKKSCKTSVIVDKFDTWRSGSIALWLNDNQRELYTAAELSGDRPWVKHIDKNQ